MGLRRKRRPLCQTIENADGIDVVCQRYAAVTVDGTHYCEKHAQESEAVPFY